MTIQLLKFNECQWVWHTVALLSRMRTRVGAVVNMTTMVKCKAINRTCSIVVLIIAAKLVINILVFSCSIVQFHSPLN